MNPRCSPAHRIHDQSGQASVEFVFAVLILTVLVFGLIDFSRFIDTRQTLISVSRDGSNLALRQTDLTNAVAAVIAAASPLTINNMGTGPKGYVIITEVTKNNNVNKIAKGGLTGVSSKIGTGVNQPATMPANVVGIPQPNDRVYITEVYYSYQPITPIGKLLKATLPTQIYDIAYFM
jgi:Flp pilus assembly protein TadG